MKRLLLMFLWLALIRCEPCYPATITPVPVGGVRINADTTGTNTRSSAITVLAQTNLYGGTLNATNSVNVGRAGEAGVLTLLSTNGTYTLTIKYDTDGALLIQPTSPDAFDIPALRVKPGTALTMGNIQDWLDGNGVLRMSLEIEGTLFTRRLFAINDGIPNGDQWTRIQYGDITIHPDLGTNTILLSAIDHSITMWQAGGTNFYVAPSSGNDGTAGLFLAADGLYHAVTSPPGIVVTNLNINPTDLRLPYRSNATTFGDSPWQYISAATNAIGFNSTNKFINQPSLTSFGVGRNALNSWTSGGNNTAVGVNGLQLLTSGAFNTAMGYNSLPSVTIGDQNTAFGYNSLAAATGSFGNTAFGSGALPNVTGDENTGVGYQAGNTVTTGTQNVYVGSQSSGSSAAVANEIVVGYQTTGKGSNTAIIGNSSVSDVYIPLRIHLDRSATNVLYRSGSDLIYTNSGSAVLFTVANTNGATMSVGLNSSIGRLVASSGSIYSDGKFGANTSGPRTSMDVLGSLAYQGDEISLTGDDTTITTSSTGGTQKWLNSDNNTPANRTIHFSSSGVRGQVMDLIVTANAAQVLNADTVGAGAIKLSADWNGTTYSSLSLRSDGTNWIETARSVK